MAQRSFGGAWLSWPVMWALLPFPFTFRVVRLGHALSALLLAVLFSGTLKLKEQPGSTWNGWVRAVWAFAPLSNHLCCLFSLSVAGRCIRCGESRRRGSPPQPWWRLGCNPASAVAVRNYRTFISSSRSRQFLARSLGGNDGFTQSQ